MSCPKMTGLLSQHWGHSAQNDCLGSCWRAVSLNEDCKHAGKGFWHGPVLLRAKPAQTSALTHDSNLSEKESWERTVCHLWLWCYGCCTSWDPLAALWKTTQESVVKVLDVLSEGESTRPAGYCGQLWQELNRGLLNGVFQCYKAQMRHTHTPREVWPAKMWPLKLQLGFPWDSL